MTFQLSLPLPSWYVSRMDAATERAMKARKNHKARRDLDARSRFYTTAALRAERAAREQGARAA